MRRHVVVVVAVAVVTLNACGGDDSAPLVAAPPPAQRADLYGTWVARQPGGYRLRYVFRRDGTYSHSEGQVQRRPRGTYRYRISHSGDMTVGTRTLVLQPRTGKVERHDPSDPHGDFSRRYPRRKQRYEWFARGSGKQARLRLTIGGGLAVTYRRP